MNWSAHEIKTAIHARDQELRHLLADITDPAEYVYLMPDNMVDALLTAERRHSTLFVSRDIAHFLRPFGLVDYCTTALTAFGAAVWRVLVEEGE